MEITVTPDRDGQRPALALEVPAGWEPLTGPAPDLPDRLVAAVAPERADGGFRANVVLTGYRRDAPVLPDWVAGGIRQRLGELPGVQIVADKPVPVGELTGTLVRITWRHPEAGTLAQAVLGLVVPLGPVVQVLELVGTAGADRIAEDLPTVDGVLRSLRVG